jgi:hypothetical protein
MQSASDQTPRHILQNCPLWRIQRDLTWPNGGTRRKTWGSDEELKRTAKCIEDIGLDIWPTVERKAAEDRVRQIGCVVAYWGDLKTRFRDIAFLRAVAVGCKWRRKTGAWPEWQADETFYLQAEVKRWNTSGNMTWEFMLLIRQYFKGNRYKLRSEHRIIHLFSEIYVFCVFAVIVQPN